MPWQVLPFLTMWYQNMGFSATSAANLYMTFRRGIGGCTVGKSTVRAVNPRCGRRGFDGAFGLGGYSIGGVFGTLLGGYIADKWNAADRDGGLLKAAIVSCSAGIPLAAIVLHVLPRDPSTTTALLHGIVLFTWTLVWCDSYSRPSPAAVGLEGDSKGRGSFVPVCGPPGPVYRPPVPLVYDTPPR
eukprot:1185765-Prorocentrum_minimum.AAC.2